MDISAGRPYPLGATHDGSGTNFALFSDCAETVELCLIDRDGGEHRITLPEVDGGVWHGRVAGVGPGQRYGYRVHGPWNPDEGFRCNPAKLLLDPYAKAVDGQIDGDPSLSGHHPDDPGRPDDRDSLGHVPLGVVTGGEFDWEGDQPPAHAFHDSVIYEAHVKGLTCRHPDVPEELRGTYAGVAHPAVIRHLKELGVTALELMPVHQFTQDGFLTDQGLSNYWGYNTIGYFAPHNAYASGGSLGGQVTEFKAMVKALHREGIEVILDVVYNHTAEGNDQGPTLSFRGIDNPSYYRLVDDSPAHYFDTTGTGNSLLMRHPAVLQLIMDSLRYWVTEMHVDGFRFDLAATLARQFHDVDKLSAFFDIVHQDPVISRVKLIAEPWDIGEGGYQVGNFPALWSEWNGRYRDAVRSFWRGDESALPEFGARIAGSADLYQSDQRRPRAGINFIAAHDGFTLRDLVSYNERHNEANGEDGRDGEADNRSWNCGVEGPGGGADVLRLRARQQRNMLATLCLSLGVPMISHGDELGRTQNGNNNVYCQDNELSWIDWELDAANTELLTFTRRALALRREQPVLRRRRFPQGAPTDATAPAADIVWLRPDGDCMTQEDWDRPDNRGITVYLCGDLLATDRAEHATRPDSLLIMYNAAAEDAAFRLPPAAFGEAWTVALDTALDGDDTQDETELKATAATVLTGHSMRVLRRPFRQP
ncbi:glycogen debranching protein GlgX [Streptomyces sp. NPDC048272]|uniref:glycogen debranching protein GlgX n=1 Tax=Streptomyces sp. NPDC048272 TaxID=3154616 RepID=UPI0034176157